MKKKLIHLILLFPMFFGCESSTMPPASLPFTISAEKVSCKDAWLKISLCNVSLPKLLFMRSSDSDGYNVHHISTKDTMFHFKGLIPGKEYTYWFYVSDNQALSKDDLKNTSNILTIRTLDTTSYYFTWKVDSIGTTQSLLNGIWGSSSNDVWAVGRFYNGHYPTSYIAHYNGYGWTQNYSPLFTTGIQGGNLNGIYGLSKDKMWVVGEGLSTIPLEKRDTTWAFAAYWNKDKWVDISPKFFNVRLWAVWAYDEYNVWAVDLSGSILYYDGKNWTEQYNNPGYMLYDIHGTDPKHLYAAGADNSYSRGILLKFNGTGWQRVPTSFYDAHGPFHSVWVESEKTVWVAGIGMILHGDGADSDDWEAQWVNYGLRKIRGLSGNDILTGGYNGAIGHFNGNTLKINMDIYADQQEFYVNDILAFKDKVFFAGQGGTGFINRKGVVFIGTR
ncbi:MAG TPA: hypothetical protein VHO03_03415 [Ignavibacteriales bacterium]|nr:hypothetical protein [Ignavibacteriales bacterium]